MFKALPMHKVVDRISYSRFLPKSAKSQFGHSEEGASTTESFIFHLATHTVTNLPPVLTSPCHLTTHTNFSTVHRELCQRGPPGICLLPFVHRNLPWWRWGIRRCFDLFCVCMGDCGCKSSTVDSDRQLQYNHHPWEHSAVFEHCKQLPDTAELGLQVGQILTDKKNLVC